MGQQNSKGKTAPVRTDLVRESKIGFGSLKRGIYMYLCKNSRIKIFLLNYGGNIVTLFFLVSYNRD